VVLKKINFSDVDFNCQAVDLRDKRLKAKAPIETPLSRGEKLCSREILIFSLLTAYRTNQPNRFQQVLLMGAPLQRQTGHPVLYRLITKHNRQSKETQHEEEKREAAGAEQRLVWMGAGSA
jgi:hypothetical protein